MKRFRLNWANSGAVGGVAPPPGYIMDININLLIDYLMCIL